MLAMTSVIVEECVFVF